MLVQIGVDRAEVDVGLCEVDFLRRTRHHQLLNLHHALEVDDGDVFFRSELVVDAQIVVRHCEAFTRIDVET